MDREPYVLPPPAAKRKTRAPLRALVARADPHGIVASPQLRALGLTRHQVAHLIDSGWLHEVHRGVYAVGRPTLGDEARWFAAVTAMGEGAVLAGRAACAKWGMVDAAPGPIDVAVPKQRRPQPGIRPRELRVDRRDWRTVDGIRVMTPARALLDLAATHRHLLERAIREAHYLRLVSTRSLGEICKRHKAQRGVKVLRGAIEDADLDRGATREQFEHLFHRFLKKHALPMPLFNERLDIGGRRIRPDCLWLEHKLVVELDSHAAHDNPQAFEQDRARDRALQRAGYRVIRITWRDLHDQPEALLMDLHHFLVDAAGARR